MFKMSKQAIENMYSDTITVTQEEFDALNARVAELTEERERGRKIAGAYHVVPKETLDAKDARIKELEARKPADLTMHDCLAGGLLVGQLQHDIAKLKAENAEFKARRNAAKKHRDKENRMACEEGKYDKCGVGGISVDAAIGAANLAESMLDDGRSLSYAAACLFVLKRALSRANHRYIDA